MTRPSNRYDIVFLIYTFDNVLWKTQIWHRYFWLQLSVVYLRPINPNWTPNKRRRKKLKSLKLLKECIGKIWKRKKHSQPPQSRPIEKYSFIELTFQVLQTPIYLNAKQKFAFWHCMEILLVYLLLIIIKISFNNLFPLAKFPNNFYASGISSIHSDFNRCKFVQCTNLCESVWNWSLL